MTTAAIEALKAEILAECRAVDPTIMCIIESGSWRVHLMPASKPAPETAEERHRREVSILTSLSYDYVRAKLTSMSVEEAAAEMQVSDSLIEEWRGRLGVFPK